MARFSLKSVISYICAHLENHKSFSSFPYYQLGHIDAHLNVRLTHDTNREVVLNMLLRPEADVSIRLNEP